MVIICKNDNVRVSILVAKEIWPAVVSMMECYDISYTEDRELGDRDHVRINDISGSGRDMMQLFEKLDQFCDGHDGKPRKIYILMSAKRKAKKNAAEYRKENSAGSKDGIRPGQDPDDSGTGDRGAVISPDDLRGLEIVEDYIRDDDNCD